LREKLYIICPEEEDAVRGAGEGGEARVTVKSDAVDLSIPAPPPFNVAFPYGKAELTIAGME